MIAIQNAQGVFIEGAEVPPIRTGYEQVIAERVSDTFASTATKKGKVLKVSARGLKVEYEGGVTRNYALGRVFGNAAGVIHPHTLKPNFKEGDVFEKGDVLVYDSHFFVPNRLMPGAVDFKNARMATTVLIDDYSTLEDGSCITPSFAEQMRTAVTEIRSITVDFDQHVDGLVKLNQHVDLDTVLCNILDPEGDNDPTQFDDDTRALLRKVGAKSPKAKSVGDVEHIEVFYYGKFEDINPQLQQVVQSIEAYNRKLAKEQGKPFYGGLVDSSFRLKGNALEPNSLAIRVYITHPVAMGSGDKLVFGNQLKSTITEVMPNECHCEDGTPIDAKFGATSIEARIVRSVKPVGFANRLIKAASKHIGNVYFDKATPKFSH